jgi:hypothetical protein
MLLAVPLLAMSEGGARERAVKLKVPTEDASPNGKNEAAATDRLGDQHTAVLLP